MQDGEVVLALEAKPGADQGLILRAAAAAAQAGLPLSPHTVERLAVEADEPSVPWSREVRESFVSLLGAGPGVNGLGGARPGRRHHAAHPGLGCRAVGPAAQRAAPVHGRSAPRRDGRAGRRADPQRRPP